MGSDWAYIREKHLCYNNYIYQEQFDREIIIRAEELSLKHVSSRELRGELPFLTFFLRSTNEGRTLPHLFLWERDPVRFLAFELVGFAHRYFEKPSSSLLSTRQQTVLLRSQKCLGISVYCKVTPSNSFVRYAVKQIGILAWKLQELSFHHQGGLVISQHQEERNSVLSVAIAQSVSSMCF